MRLVSVVTRMRPPRPITMRHSASRSSTWRSTGRTSVTGSISPVGRITCSANTPCTRSISHGPGVALTMDGLRPEALPLLELQRPVVEAGRQPEAELRQDGLARMVAPLHAADLRHGDVALVDDQQRVLGQVLEQRRRRIALLAAREVARVVLDSLAGAGGLDHLEVEGAALLQALGLQQLAAGGELRRAAASARCLMQDRRLVERRARRHVVAVGIDVDLVELAGASRR